MKQVAVAAAPDEILFVLDSTIGQAAYDQARAFKDAVAVGGMRSVCVRAHVVHVCVCVGPTIGQAYEQVLAFKDAVAVGVCLCTSMCVRLCVRVIVHL